MVILVIGLLVYWVVQTASHRGGDTDETVSDWRTSVAQVQTVEKIAYPATIPAGWTVTSAAWDTDDDPRHPLWRLGLVTPDQQFAGVYQQQASAADLVARTVDQGRPHSTGTVHLPTALGDTWQAWAGTDDHEYSTTIGATTLVVYGTSDAEVRQLMGVLTTDMLPASAQNG